MSTHNLITHTSEREISDNEFTNNCISFTLFSLKMWHQYYFSGGCNDINSDEISFSIIMEPRLTLLGTYMYIDHGVYTSPHDLDLIFMGDRLC